MRKFRSWLKKEDGVALVLTALCLTAIVSMMALVIDLGIAVYRRAEIQAVCDVTALATARYLNRDTNDVAGAAGPAKTTLVQYGKECFALNANAKYPPGTTSVTYENTDADYVFNNGNLANSKSNEVTVGAKLTVQTNFARVMGINDIDIHVTATAYSDFAEDPDSMWVKSIVSNKKVTLAGSGATFASVHANEGVDFGYCTNTTVKTTISTSNGVVSGVSSNPPKTEDGSDPEYKVGVKADIAEEGKKMLDYLNTKASSNKIDYDSFYVTTAPGSKNWNEWEHKTLTNDFFKVISPSVETKKSVYYKCGNNAIINCAKFTVKHDMYIDGDMYLNAYQGVTINKDVTLYVTGDLGVASSITCNGNLVVLGNLNITGQGFNSPDTTKTEQALIYVGGTSASFGTAGSLCENISICAPNATYFQITGGNTTFKGTIMGNNLSNVGTATLKVVEPTIKSQFVDMINVLCLVD